MATRERRAADACEGQMGRDANPVPGGTSSRPPAHLPSRDWKAWLLLGPWGLLTGLAAPGTRTAQYFWLALASVVVFAVAFGFYLRAEISIERTHEERFESYRLADELRQSSDDLTRMIRTYVATAEGHGLIMRTLLAVSGLALVVLFWCLLRAIQAEKRIKLENEAELERHRFHLEQLVEERTEELTERNSQLTEEITAREHAVAALNASESKLRFIAENTRDVIWMLEVATHRFTYVSPSVEGQRGFTAAEVMSRPMEAALTKESADRMRELLAATISAWKAGERPDTLHLTDLAQPHRDGRVIHTELLATLHGDPEGNLASVLGVTRDVTERRRTEETVRRLAFYDGLTDLPNRRLMTDRLDQYIALARRGGSRVALLLIDLDKFKPVNDELGHHTGDWLLQVVAQRIAECLRETDTAARIGGDEFVAVLPNVQDALAALTVGRRIHASLEKPFVTAKGEQIEISSSIGIACYPDHAANAGELLRAGDRAMYRAKRNGRRQVHVLPLGDRNSIPPTSSEGLQLQWDASYVSGNPIIDAEHRELFRQVARLLEAAVLSPTNAGAHATAFETLVRSVAEHFGREEDILRAVGYARVEEHAAQHRGLLRRAFALALQVRTDQATVGELVDFLAADLVGGHIAQDDRNYYSALTRRPQDSHRSQPGIAV